MVNMKLLMTPPDCMKVGDLRAFIDSQDQPLRRAYYSLGNYVAAKQVLASTSPVIMDRSGQVLVMKINNPTLFAHDFNFIVSIFTA